MLKLTNATSDNGVTAPDTATITLKTADSTNSGEAANHGTTESTISDEAAFVAATLARNIYMYTAP